MTVIAYIRLFFSITVAAAFGITAWITLHGAMTKPAYLPNDGITWLLAAFSAALITYIASQLGITVGSDSGNAQSKLANAFNGNQVEQTKEACLRLRLRRQLSKPHQGKVDPIRPAAESTMRDGFDGDDVFRDNGFAAAIVAVDTGFADLFAAGLGIGVIDGAGGQRLRTTAAMPPPVSPRSGSEWVSPLT